MREALRKIVLGNGHGNGHPPPAEKPKPEAVLVCLEDVVAVPVRWLWEHWIPRGCLTILDGDPGLSKSTLTLDLAARVSQGWAMPPGGELADPVPEGPGGVLLLSAEDGLANTIRPRLDAAEADHTRIHYLKAIRTGDDERPPVLPWDLELVAGMVKALGIRMVVIDPLAAFLDAEYDAHKDQDIRRCLHQMALFAERLDLGAVLVRHLNKLNGGPALYRGGGSIGIIGAARSGLVVGRDPADPAVRVLACNKSNLGPIPRSLAYRVEPAGTSTRLAWVGETDLGPADILWHEAQPQGRPDAERQDATAFLLALLAGGPVPARQVYSEGADAGFSSGTLKRAKADAGIAADKVGGQWIWSLPK